MIKHVVVKIGYQEIGIQVTNDQEMLDAMAVLRKLQKYDIQFSPRRVIYEAQENPVEMKIYDEAISVEDLDKINEEDNI